MTTKDTVLNFIEDNPRCTSRQLYEALDISPITVNMVLQRARRNGLIRAIPMDGARTVEWVIATEVEGDFEPSRIVVKQWTGHKRDDWTTLFFGAAA